MAEWSKASDLSSDSRKRAWVRTPHLTEDNFVSCTEKEQPPNIYGMLCENFDMLFIYFMPETKISDRLQWRNRLAHGTYRQYEYEQCRGCEFEPHLEQLNILLVAAMNDVVRT